jgi:predicted hotdog family 3-hydroxylacyl-ACP dehydratase
MQDKINIAFPPVGLVLPHGESMVLLDKILFHKANKTNCLVVIKRDALFSDETGKVATWVGLEYMAQCVAVHAGLIAKSKGEDIKIGYWIGSRKISFDTDFFHQNQALIIKTNKVWQDAQLGSFECSIIDKISGNKLMGGLLSFFLP